MTVYIGINEEDVEDTGGAQFTNYSFWNLKEKIYETLTKEEAIKYSLFIGLMNGGEVHGKDLDKFVIELNGLIEKLADDYSKLILSDILNVAKYAKDEGKNIIMN